MSWEQQLRWQAREDELTEQDARRLLKGIGNGIYMTERQIWRHAREMAVIELNEERAVEDISWDWRDTSEGVWTFAEVKDVSTQQQLLAAITWRHTNGLEDKEIVEAVNRNGDRLNRIIRGLLGHVPRPVELYDLIGKRTRSIEFVRAV
jgi:hypothetical protein